tara:strand:- start:2620 stop:3588 length:969 start_codon:yes stop_codon:yes gene_type:complete
MKYIPFLIRKVLDSYRDTIKIQQFLNLKSLNGSLIGLKIFFIKFFYSFSFLRNLRGPKYIKIRLSETDQNFFHNEQVDINKTVTQIDKDGFSNILILKNFLINSFEKLVLESNNHDLQKIPDSAKTHIFKNEQETKDCYFKRIQSLGISRITGYVDLNKENCISNFLLSDACVKLAKSYLGATTMTISASYFISFASSNLEEKEKIANAQYFHWDNDFSKFLKLYIYLSDVDENSGPHVFVPRTHKKKLFKHKLHRPYADSDIYNSYPKVKSFLGNKGSSFFVDSYGLHKGEMLKKNNRIMLNVHYGKGKLFYSSFDKFIRC